MSWIAVGVMAGTAALGYTQQRQQQKAINEHNKGQAEMTRYSPWTGVRGETQANTADPLVGALQGGLSGYALGSNISNKLGSKVTPDSVDTSSVSRGSQPMGDVSFNDRPMNDSVGSSYNKGADPLAQPSFYNSMKKQNPYRRDPYSVV